jgi:hypothetical protein
MLHENVWDGSPISIQRGRLNALGRPQAFFWRTECCPRCFIYMLSSLSLSIVGTSVTRKVSLCLNEAGLRFVAVNWVELSAAKVTPSEGHIEPNEDV